VAAPFQPPKPGGTRPRSDDVFLPGDDGGGTGFVPTMYLEIAARACIRTSDSPRAAVERAKEALLALDELFVDLAKDQKLRMRADGRYAIRQAALVYLRLGYSGRDAVNAAWELKRCVIDTCIALKRSGRRAPKIRKPRDPNRRGRGKTKVQGVASPVPPREAPDPVTAMQLERDTDSWVPCDP
jgi:hypothetical protein